MWLEANIFRIFMSLWYLLLVKISKNPWGKSDMPWMITWNYPIKCFFLLATVAMITAKISFIHFHNRDRETYSFIKIMQPISPNNNWENGVKQIEITEENLSQSIILCQLRRTNTLASGSKCIKNIFFYFYHYLPYICWVDVIYLTCLVFLKSPWWLVWIFCAPTSLT